MQALHWRTSTFGGMEQQDPTPPECFRFEELQAFQAVESAALVDVNYFLWLNNTEPDQPPYRFLYAVELVFEGGGALLLSSGEDSEAIRLLSAENLLKTAQALQALHRQMTIQRLAAGAFPLWSDVLGQPLQAVRLTRHESGLYLNDALVFDFGEKQILVQLSPKEGLELGPYA